LIVESGGSGGGGINDTVIWDMDSGVICELGASFMLGIQKDSGIEREEGLICILKILN
jgi:hypothetical protein